MPWENPVDSIWTELFSYVENLWLASDAGDSVNSHGDAFPILLSVETEILYDQK